MTTSTSSARTRRRATRPAGSPVVHAPAEAPVASVVDDPAIADTDEIESDAAHSDTAHSDTAHSATTDSEEQLPEATKRRRLTRQVLVRAVLACVVIALAGATAGVLIVDHRTTQEVALRERLLAGARQTALNMTTLQADTAKSDVDRLLAGASGDFLAQFQDRQSDFVDVVGQAGVNSTGTVVSAGIESVDGNCAVSLVGADAQVSNKDDTTPAPRSFRFRITMCENDGTVTATAVDFVP